MRTEHILIIRFSALGDVAMTVPVIYSLARTYPHVRFTMVSRGSVRPLFQALAPNVGFMEADIKTEYKGVRGLNALYRRLTAKQPTAIADLHSVLRSDYLRMRFNLGMYKVAHIDKHRAGKRALTATDNKRLEQQPTSFENYAEVFAKLGYPVDIKFTSIFPQGRGDITKLPASITQEKTPAGGARPSAPHPHPWIGIAPFAAHEGKIYPLELMEQVVGMLAEHHPDSRIFLFGGNSEMAVFSGWCRRFSQCVCVPEHIHGLRKELILMSHLDVMLSMDSANMHLASLVNVPVVSVWGATHPFAGFMGWGQSMDNVVQLDMSCRPCSIYGNRKCMRGHIPCLKNIQPKTIVDKIDNIISFRFKKKG